MNADPKNVMVWKSLALVALALSPARSGAQEVEHLDDRPTAVTRDYYSQLHASIDVEPPPKAGSQAKAAFKSMLAALGARKDAQNVSVSVQVAVGDLQFPEYLLAAYAYDAGTKSLDTYRNAGHDFPRKRLDSGERILVDVRFRDSDQVRYNFGKVSDAIGALVPGTSLVSAVSKPFVQGIGKVGGTVMEAMGSSVTSRTYHYELSPLGGNPKAVDLRLQDQAGRAFATLHLSLKATPTLLRDGTNVFQAGQGDFRLSPQEDPATLEFQVGGIRSRYIDEVRTIESYPKLAGAGAGAGAGEAIVDFCSDARTFLETTNGLAPLDSAPILLRAMENAGFDDFKKDTTWFHQCFLPAEKRLLSSAMDMNVPLPAPAVPDPIDNGTLYALGCWMVASSGPKCAMKAPDPERVLNTAFQEQVQFNVDSGFMDTRPWGESGSVSRTVLITALKSSASGFSCFNRGMLIDVGGRLFRFTGETDGGAIRSIAIRPAPDDAGSCTT